jgi:hypothetical protein
VGQQQQQQQLAAAAGPGLHPFSSPFFPLHFFFDCFLFDTLVVFFFFA